MEELLAITRTVLEGWAAVISGLVLFCGSVLLLLAAIFGLRMGYLMMATGLFAFMIVLSALWSFGAPGTPAFLGPKGELPHWVALDEGASVSSATHPVVGEYPGGPWVAPPEPTETTVVAPEGEEGGLAAEVDAASLVFQEFLAEEANAEAQRAGVEGEILPEDFEITDIRFTKAGDTELAAARGHAIGGGPEVVVVGFKDQGNLEFPSYAFLAASVIGFLVHLPFLDRAERRRKEILTGGEQPPFRGPA